MGLYNSIVYRNNGQIVSSTDLAKKETFEKIYYTASGIIHKIEYYKDDSLMKVSYYNSEKPNDRLLKEHFSIFPQIAAEFITPKELITNEIFRTFRYVCRSESELQFITEDIEDGDGHLLKEYNLKENGERLGSKDYFYDDTWEMIGILEYNQEGALIGELDFYDD